MRLDVRREERGFTCLGLAIENEQDALGQGIQSGKEELSQSNIIPSIGQRGEKGKDIDKSCWVPRDMGEADEGWRQDSPLPLRI